MLRLALRGLATHKLRGSLTALAILLGVAMVAGTLMLSDSVNRSFDDIFSEANAGIDVSVRAKQEIDAGFDLPESGVALPESLLPEVEAVDGVKQVSGSIGDATTIAILDENGERIGPPQGGPPHIATSVEPEPFTPYTYIEGGPPAADDQVSIDSFTAEEEGYELGQSVPITGAEGVRDYELVGISRFGSGVPLGGASLVEFTLPEAQRITAKQGEFDQIAAEADDGVSPDELRDRIKAALPPKLVEVRTGDEIATEDSQDIKDGFSFLTILLLVFAGITVFVGGFLIFNTFSITVAQRTREFGMLRTIGASSRQVLSAVIVEALAIGLLASIVGIGAGAGFVKVLLAIFGLLGFELPQSGLPLEPRTVVIALAVGMLSTLLSAAIPAVRATRVSPLEALREDGGKPAEAGSRRRSIIATVLSVVGIALILLGLFGGSDFGAALGTMGLGLVLLFFGIAALGGKAVAPFAAGIGRPIQRLRPVTGQLARENTLRNPARTATTSSALMIGAALVVFVLMLGSALTKSVGEALDKTFTGDVAIFNVDGFSPISARIAPGVGDLEGVQSASPLAAAGGHVEGTPEGEDQLIYGWDAATLTDAAELDWVDGSDATLADLGDDGAIVESKWAEDNDVAVGDTISVLTPSGETVGAEVKGSVRDRVSLLVESVALPIATLRDDFVTRQDALVLVSFDEGADFDTVRTEVDDLLATDFPQAEASSQQQLKDDNKEAIQGAVFLIYVLLTMAVILSLVGVVNTLVLTVLERKRELGMLRAIGASKRQVRQMVRYESVITAMIGAVIGTAIGIGIGLAAITALADEGLVLSIPFAGLIAVLILSALAGVVAGIWPARRASRVEVMEALQYE